jgi:hypothetical protein
MDGSPATSRGRETGSSGWPAGDGRQRRFYELFARGGSAAELFDHPTAGASVEVSPE